MSLYRCCVRATSSVGHYGSSGRSTAWKPAMQRPFFLYSEANHRLLIRLSERLLTSCAPAAHITSARSFHSCLHRSNTSNTNISSCSRGGGDGGVCNYSLVGARSGEGTAGGGTCLLRRHRGRSCVYLHKGVADATCCSRRGRSSCSAQTFDFAPPSRRTPEMIAYTACPVCGVVHHMLDMLLHLTTVHHDLDAQRCRAICQARLQLYEQLTGSPLQRTSSSAAVLSRCTTSHLGYLRTGKGACVATDQSHGTHALIDASALASPALMNEVHGNLLNYLPSVTEQGYRCNWCTRSDRVYTTRDAFLRHVDDTHVSISVDLVEPHIPLLPSRARIHSASQTRCKDAPDSPSDSSSSRKFMSHTNQSASCVGSAAVQQHHHPNRTPNTSHFVRVSTSQPVKSVSHWNRNRDNAGGGTPVPKLGGEPAVDVLLTRCKTISLPRVMSFDRAEIAPPLHVGDECNGSNIDRNSSGGTHCTSEQPPCSGVSVPSMQRKPTEANRSIMTFGPNHFPCEMCGRVLKTEVDLLRHLEDRHPSSASEMPFSCLSQCDSSSGTVSDTPYRMPSASCSSSVASSDWSDRADMSSAFSSQTDPLHVTLQHDAHFDAHTQRHAKETEGARSHADSPDDMQGTDQSSCLSSSYSIQPHTAASLSSPAAAAVDTTIFAGRVVSDRFPCPIRCDLCAKSSRLYMFQSALYAHICMKHPQEQAAFEVERMIELARHSARHVVCPVCQAELESAKALEEHKARIHRSSCPDDADSVSVLADTESDHVYTGITSKTLTRSATNSVASSRSARGKSDTGLPAVDERTRWWCHECERGFRQVHGLYEHKISKHHMLGKPHPCPACKRVFRDMYALERHLTAQHPAIQVSDLGLTTHATCPTCRREFLTPEELHRHTMRHHGRPASLPVRMFEVNLVKPMTTTAATTTTAPLEIRYHAAGASPLQDGQTEEVAKPRKVARRARAHSSDV